MSLLQSFYSQFRTRTCFDPWILLSGVLIVLAFPALPWTTLTTDFSFFIWIALVPFFLTLTKAKSFRESFLLGIWLSFFMTLGGFYWTAYAMHQFGGLHWFLSLLGLLLFGLICQPQFALFALCFHGAYRKFGSRHPLLTALCFSLIYTAIDSYLPKVFLDQLGHSLYLNSSLRQLASFGGVPFLTFIIVFFNAALFEFVRRKNQARTTLVAASLMLLICWGYGFYQAKHIQGLIENPAKTFNAAVIQGNIGDFEKLLAERSITSAAQKVLDQFFFLSDEALKKDPQTDFIVWPETTYPSTFRTPETSRQAERDKQVELFTQSRGVPLLFGGYDRNDTHDFNALFALHPNSDLLVYRKNILLPFGEYLPFLGDGMEVRKLFPQMGFFGRGVGPTVLEIRAPHNRIVKISPVICYEALFSYYSIDAAKQGSEVILNVTNDSWFGPYGEPYLHLALTTFRSIETRLSQVRSTNTGISTLILPSGEITQPSSLFVPEVLNLKVPVIAQTPTLIKSWGEWFAFFSVIAAIALSIWLLKTKKTGV